MNSNCIIITIILVTKFGLLQTPAQNFQWARQIGSSLADRGYAICTDNSGNIYATGEFRDTADFDPGSGALNLISMGSADAYVCKLNFLGNISWAIQFGGSSLEFGRAIAFDNKNGLVIAGKFRGTCDFDPSQSSIFNLTSAGSDDVFVSKVDTSGKLLWARRWGSANDDQGWSICTDSDGNVYTTGVFRGTVDFDPGAGTFNLVAGASGDVFISKLDSSGNFVWAISMGSSTYTDNGYAITTDDSGNVYVCGNFYSVADFDPGTGIFNMTSAGGSDIFVAKLNASGTLVWAKQLGGSSNDAGRGIGVDSYGYVYITGSFSGTSDFDPSQSVYNLISIGSADIYITKLNSGGNFIWTKQLGGGYIDEGRGLSIDNTGNVYITGNFSDTVDFDTGINRYDLISRGEMDVFVVKLNFSGDFQWAVRWGSNASDYSYSICVDKLSWVYTTGHFNDTTDFDPGTNVYNLIPRGADIFVQKIGQGNGTGYIDNLVRTALIIYPNPFLANTSILFDEDGFKSLLINLYSIEGKLVRTEYGVTGQILTLYRNDLTSGLYIAEVIVEGKIKLKEKIVIQ